MYRITDEIEARTDVRSQGMHGFYSNLLTKNVAMGGDVEGSALSAYTAGSQRQSKMSSSSAQLSQGSVDTDSANATSSDSGAAHGEKRKYGVTGEDTESDVLGSTKSAKSEKIMEMDSPDLSNSHFRSEAASTTASNPAATAAPAPSKDEIISSARQRFLDRKSASSL